MKYTYLAIFFFSLIFSSCKKGCTDPAAINYDNKLRRDDGSCSYPDATISITSPVANHTYLIGDTITINAIGSHYQDLTGWNLSILNKTKDSSVYSLSSTDTGKDLSIKGAWINNVSDTSVMELSIVLKVNDSGKTVSQAIEFTCLP